MSDLLAVLAFALVWALFFGPLTLFNLAVGVLLGLLVLSVVQRDVERSFPRRLWALLRFAGNFLVELVVANVGIARLALSPRIDLHPHVVAVPLRVKSDAAITLLAATITLLPGTVAMGVSADKSRLYAHAIGAAAPAVARDGIRRIETLILGFME